ncbi:restriction endonuclease subunit S [Providencia vermicola]|uniref:restriction endonuclease subunit S n=1 Tax=Providencia vermicola TaxID=333965 RepID=UPI0032D9C84F
MAKIFPNDWVSTKLEIVVEILDAMRIPVNNNERQSRIEGKLASELFPYYGATGEVGKIDGYLFNEELVALGEDGVPFFDHLKTKAYLLTGKTWVNNHAHVLKGWPNGLNNKLLLHYLNQFDYQGYVNGGTRLKLTQANMRTIPVPLPPLAEQKSIVDKLNTLLTKVEQTKTRLERIPELLKIFRQSVLSAAVSGKLTEEWRNLQNINIDSWLNGILGDFVEKPTYGSSSKSQPEGIVPVLRMGNLQDGKLDWTDLVYTSNPVEIDKYKLSYGDVLFNRTNSPELVGKTSIFRGEREAIYAGYLIRIVCKKNLNPEFLNYLLNSPNGKNYCYQVKSDGVSQSNINAQKLKTFPVTIPTMVEQAEIVHRIEELFAFADNIERKANAALERVNNLTQSILAKAFRGELTADWRAANPDLISGENSAESLLEKIKAERKALEPAKKTRARKNV